MVTVFILCVSVCATGVVYSCTSISVPGCSKHLQSHVPRCQRKRFVFGKEVQNLIIHHCQDLSVIREHYVSE